MPFHDTKKSKSDDDERYIQRNVCMVSSTGQLRVIYWGEITPVNNNALVVWTELTSLSDISS